MRKEIILFLFIPIISFSQVQDTVNWKKIEIGLQVSSPEAYTWYTSPGYENLDGDIFETNRSNLFTTGASLSYNLRNSFVLRLRGSYTSSFKEYTRTSYGSSAGDYSIYEFR